MNLTLNGLCFLLEQLVSTVTILSVKCLSSNYLSLLQLSLCLIIKLGQGEVCHSFSSLAFERLKVIFSRPSLPIINLILNFDPSISSLHLFLVKIWRESKVIN